MSVVSLPGREGGRQQWVPTVDLGVPVVQDQQQRPAGSRRPQKPGQAVEQPEPGRLRLNRRRGRQVRQTVADGGNYLGDVGRAGTHVLAQHRRVHCLDIGTDDLDSGPERRRALPLPAAAPQHQDPTRNRRGSQLLSQPGLADTGLPGHQHHPTWPPTAASKWTASSASSPSRPTNGVVTRPPPQARS